jgi:hypothetical protein
MATFVFTYRSPEDYVPRPETVSAWADWLDGMGTALADRGRPVRAGRQVGDCGLGNHLGGYSVITAADLDAAVQIASGCPGLQHGFGVEVGEVAELPERANA